MQLFIGMASMPHTMGVTKILLLPLGFSILFLAIALYGLQMRQRDGRDNHKKGNHIALSCGILALVISASSLSYLLYMVVLDVSG